MPNSGLRQDGTAKGQGWLGPMKMTNGSNLDMTEFSIGVNIGGKEVLIPTLTPLLSKEELSHLLNGGSPTQEIINKSVIHAKDRLKLGLSPFKD